MKTKRYGSVDPVDFALAFSAVVKLGLAAVAIWFCCRLVVAVQDILMVTAR